MERMAFIGILCWDRFPRGFSPYKDMYTRPDVYLFGRLPNFGQIVYHVICVTREIFVDII